MMRDSPIDLRSDTVTRPSPGMRRAIAAAEVGDDVFGDDPTVLRLQEMVAELLGKEAALLTPSGTMANQIAIRAHAQPGDEIIVERSAHVVMAELGALAGLAGVQASMADGRRGIITAEQVRELIRPLRGTFPKTRLICLENTHNFGGGTIFPIEVIGEIQTVAREHGISMHLDGARLMNAVVASGVTAAAYASCFESVSTCMSKGLGAPVGSLVAGSCDFIDEVHRFRKMYGGGMRQAGILAAAGIYAYENNVERLADDHTNARRLAEGLAEMPGITTEAGAVETNIVLCDIEDNAGSPAHLVERLASEGVLLLAIGKRTLRAVTHLDVNRDDIDRALAIIDRVLAAGVSG